MLIKRSQRSAAGFINRVLKTPGGIWIPNDDLFVPRNRNVLAVLSGPQGKRLLAARNIVTNAGDVYYAQSAAGESPTNAFDRLSLSSVDFSPGPSKTSDAGDLASVISGATSAFEATYPKTNDGDADNTGAGTDIITWLAAYAKGDFNDADIEDGCIHVNGATFGTGSDPLLTAFSMTQFAKTADDTLKVFVNHEFAGV